MDKFEKIYEFLNDLHLQYEGREIYFGTAKEFCREHNISEYDYYEYDWFDIRLPKRGEFIHTNSKIMYVLKNLETNETIHFETLQDVAQWFNFCEDIYADGVWDRFIEHISKNHEIRRIVYYVAADLKVDKNFPIKNEEDDDDIPF